MAANQICANGNKGGISLSTQTTCFVCWIISMNFHEFLCHISMVIGQCDATAFRKIDFTKKNLHWLWRLGCSNNYQEIVKLGNSWWDDYQFKTFLWSLTSYIFRRVGWNYILIQLFLVAEVINLSFTFVPKWCEKVYIWTNRLCKDLHCSCIVIMYLCYHCVVFALCLCCICICIVFAVGCISLEAEVGARETLSQNWFQDIVPTCPQPLQNCPLSPAVALFSFKNK